MEKLWNEPQLVKCAAFMGYVTVSSLSHWNTVQLHLKSMHPAECVLATVHTWATIMRNVRSSPKQPSSAISFPSAWLWDSVLLNKVFFFWQVGLFFFLGHGFSLLPNHSQYYCMLMKWSTNTSRKSDIERLMTSCSQLMLNAVILVNSIVKNIVLSIHRYWIFKIVTSYFPQYCYQLYFFTLCSLGQHTAPAHSTQPHHTASSHSTQENAWPQGFEHFNHRQKMGFVCLSRLGLIKYVTF